MSLIWDLFQQRGIDEARRTADDAAHRAAASSSRADGAAEKARELEERLDCLTLVSMAVWSLLRDRAKLTEADLLERVQELDLRDGVPDGKRTRQVAKCPKCDRVMSPRHRRCLYCGSEELVQTAFDAI